MLSIRIEWFDAPHTVENEGAIAGPADSSLGFGNDGTADGDEGDSGEQNPTRGTPPDDGEREGFCDPNGIFPGEEDKQFLNISANSQIFVLTGAGISKESGINIFRDQDGFYGIIIK